MLFRSIHNLPFVSQKSSYSHVRQAILSSSFDVNFDSLFVCLKFCSKALGIDASFASALALQVQCMFLLMVLWCFWHHCRGIAGSVVGVFMFFCLVLREK